MRKINNLILFSDKNVKAEDKPIVDFLIRNYSEKITPEEAAIQYVNQLVKSVDREIKDAKNSK